MSTPKDSAECLDLLSVSLTPEGQTQIRALLPRGDAYYDIIVRAYFRNPFLVLTDDEIAYASKALTPPALGGLVAAREAATRLQTPRYSVCCMPKSGSSFVQSALRHALQVSSVSVTGFGLAGLGSQFGMNSREQEIDEFALVSRILTSPRGFVAQNHTRYSTYLGLLYRRFEVTPIVTFRNVLDCIVSFDEMVLTGRAANPTRWAWHYDTQFAVPASYPTLADEARYAILAKSFGVWLIAFYLSWRRSEQQDFVKPLFLRYEDHILDKERFVDELSRFAAMTDVQRERLRQYAAAPDKGASRFNVGVKGRGVQKVPASVREFLRDYASAFDDLSQEDLEYLLPSR